MTGARPYILVVDDLADAADSMADLLGLWGYAAGAAYRGAGALAACRRRPPAAALVDARMPEMSGFEFVARLRAVPGCDRTYVIIVTGDTTDACRDRGRELGAVAHILKPADPCVLEALLAALTTRRGQGPGRLAGPPRHALPAGCRLALTGSDGL